MNSTTMVQYPHQNVASTVVSGQPGVKSRGRVMISGTQQDTRFMMRVLLEMWGFQVIEADGETETISKAESERPELIVIDTSKQFEDEIKLVSQIRGSGAQTSVPIIVLSGYPQADYQKAAFEHGATGHLIKPLDLDMFEDYLDTCLEQFR